MSNVQNAVIGTVRTVLGWVPSQWLPGGTPDPLIERRAAIGQQASRLDGPAKVSGQARFAADVAMAGLSYATLVHSPITRGRITKLESGAAEAAPGVILVMTYHNMPRLGIVPMIGGTNLSAAGNSALPTMQGPDIWYNGQVVAMVLAETQEQADYAASLIEIDYREDSAKTSFENAKPDSRAPASVLFEKNHVSIGNAEQELNRAAFKVDNIYRTPGHNHNAIELHAVTVAWDGDTVLLHDATQAISATASAIAKLFNLKNEQVRVLSPLVGGGFGGKAFWDHQIIAVAAAKLAARPVRLILSRDSVYRMIGGRSPSEQRVAVGADAEGKFTSIIHTGYSIMPPYAACPEPYTLGTRAIYKSKSFEIIQRYLDLDIVPNTFMRAPGEAIGTFALENAVDELAHEMGLDPIELRLRNEPEKHPISGATFSQHATRQAYLDGAERFGWEQREARPGARRDGEWRIGMGCASGGFPYVRMPGVNIRIELRRDGSAKISCSAQEMGMGTATVQTQHAADRLGLPVEAISFELGDSALPVAPMAGGSSQTASLSGAVIAGAERLTIELLRLAGNDSPIAGLRAGEVQLAKEGIASLDDPSRYESFRSIMARASRDEVTVTASGSPPLEMFKFAMHSSSAIFCQLRVSDVTGEIRVDRMLGSFDCGTILNPKTAASQFKGGMIMGLGLALTEETLFDERSGRIMNASLADYHVPSHLDVPEIDVIWTGIPDPRSPLGARGIGEIGITGVAAAVANAVFNATGTRVRDLPITLDKVLSEIP
ncbi:xanthine dehydrogenase family protein molybdopterin-binding subunit [Phyllobacterium bourgognense]|uniref:Xanthine dehydrogenase YagR molybdenum-binding subunit n=1 Tax=Phyllobacterium bourgognense TaxID=314236 RepID=A0A368YLX1_9HYPH|nr:xanthine dehydrogenase family protein molybdopterin-binding subunit [Phyllobacterium bourgognense]RCW81232.1 xanthine dehydrogenase YagR molybdenum-binding subunit [Phyllobacterium bourgognense]